jgi:hypothetical protein
VSLARPLDPARRSASLVPRELCDYLPRSLLRAQRGLGIAVVLGVVAIAIVPYPDDATEPDMLGLLSFGAFLGAFAALGGSDVQALRWAMWPLALLALVLSISACLDISHQPWRVRRGVGRSAGAAPA